MSEIEALQEMVAKLAHRVDVLEDINAIRRLHYACGYLIDYCR